MPCDETPDALDYATSTEANLAIVRALGEIRFAEKMKVLMPLVARELVKAGVDFSKARMTQEALKDSASAPSDAADTPHPAGD